jgi:hypothetical protein
MLHWRRTCAYEPPSARSEAMINLAMAEVIGPGRAPSTPEPTSPGTQPLNAAALGYGRRRILLTELAEFGATYV